MRYIIDKHSMRVKRVLEEYDRLEHIDELLTLIDYTSDPSEIIIGEDDILLIPPRIEIGDKVNLESGNKYSIDRLNGIVPIIKYRFNKVTSIRGEDTEINSFKYQSKDILSSLEISNIENELDMNLNSVDKDTFTDRVKEGWTTNDKYKTQERKDFELWAKNYNYGNRIKHKYHYEKDGRDNLLNVIDSERELIRSKMKKE